MGFQNNRERYSDSNGSDGGAVLDVQNVTKQVQTANSTVKPANYGARVVIDGTVLSGNVGDVYGVYAETKIKDADGNNAPLGYLAPLVAVVDIQQGANVAGANGTYGLVIIGKSSDANSTVGHTATARQTAFARLEDTNNANGHPTSYVFDILGVANSTTALISTVTANVAAANGALRIRVNGAAKHILLYDVA